MVEIVTYKVNESLTIELKDVTKDSLEGVYRFVEKNKINGSLKATDFLSYIDEFGAKKFNNSKNAKLVMKKPGPVYEGEYAASFFKSNCISHLELIRSEMNLSFGNKSIAIGDLCNKGYNKIEVEEYFTKKKPGIKIPETFHLNHWKFENINYEDYVTCFKVIKD